MKVKLRHTKSTGNKEVGVREFCRLLGVGPGVWYSYFKRGQVEYCNQEKTKIDYEKMLARIRELSQSPNYYSDLQIAKRRVAKGYTSPEEANKEIATKKIVVTRKSTSSISNDSNGMGEVAEPDDREFTRDMTRREAESVKQVYLAKQAKVKFLKEIRALTETKVFMDHAVIMATNLQKSILSVPGRVAELYASMSDGATIKKDLTRELTFALSKLKFDIEGVTTEAIDDWDGEDEEDNEEKDALNGDISEVEETD